MAIKINDNFNARTPKPLDDRWGVWDMGVWRGFNTISEATTLLANYRYVGLTALVNIGGENKEYWFKDGTDNNSFIEKTVDLSGYYTKEELQTSGNAEVHWGNITNTPDLMLQGDNISLLNNDAGYITNSDLPSAQTLSFSSATGSLSISGGNNVSLDGRYSLIGHAHPISDIIGLQTALNNKVNTNLEITNSYGITIGGSLSTSLSLGVDTDTLDARYLRKDVDDNNGVRTLTLGNLISETATIQSSFNLPSLSTGTSNDILIVGSNGLIQKKALVIGGSFGIANNTGTKQFDVALGTNLRFQGTGDTAVSFNPATMTVTINSIPGQGGGGFVTSFNGRIGPVVSEIGDYTTSIVSEGTNLYHTASRVRTVTLDGLSVSNTAILATDNIVQAFGKTQGQINAKANSAISLTVNGTAGRVLVSGATQNLTANRTWTVDLANGIATAGTYPKVTVDTYGRVTSGASLVAADIPNLDAGKITTGVFNNARLGSGTAGAGTFLSANGWAIPPNDNTTYSGSTSITLSGTSFQRAALTGDVTAAENSNVLTIADNAVTYARFQNVPGSSLIGRGATGDGSIGRVTIGANLALSTAGVLSATNTTYTAGTLAQLNAGTVTTNYIWAPKTIADYAKGSFIAKSGDEVSGDFTFNSNIGNRFVIRRTNLGDNATIRFQTTTGSVYAGARTGSSFGIGGGGDLSGSYWFSIGTNSALFSGNVSAAGDVIAYSTSDSTLKDSIKVITKPLDKLSQISGNTFVWNDKQEVYEAGTEDYGVIAQEVETILPHAVTTRENGTKAVKYDRLIPLLIEGIKELRKELNELKGGVN